MANLNGFDATQVDPTVAYEPIPAGKYLVAITESELKPTKNNSGSYLQLTFEVLEGEFRGRKVWDRLCVNHPNPMTVKIARGNLSAICRAVGVMQPRDSVDLHNLPLLITVKLKKREDTGELTNERREDDDTVQSGNVDVKVGVNRASVHYDVVVTPSDGTDVEPVYGNVLPTYRVQATSSKAGMEAVKNHLAESAKKLLG